MYLISVLLHYFLKQNYSITDKFCRKLVLYHNTSFLQKVPNLMDLLLKDIMKYVRYEIRCLLLSYLESLLGSTDFESYLKAYLEKFKYKNINTDS